MMKKIIIIGSGGDGRVCAEIAELCGYSEIMFLDDGTLNNNHVIGSVDEFIKYVGEFDFFVAIGDNKARETILKKIKLGGANIVSLIHPASTVSKTAKLGTGSVVMAGAVINAGAIIGDGTIINTSSSVDHDCVVGDYCHISVGTHLAGNVRVCSGTFVGAGAVIINNKTIYKKCIIGAGAVLISDVNESGTYVGVPAKKMK